jgi:hypothetical protein
MHSLEEDVEAVANDGKADEMSSSEETDDEEADDSSSPVQKTWDTSYTFPLELGTLRVLTLGTHFKYTSVNFVRQQMGFRTCE